MHKGRIRDQLLHVDSLWSDVQVPAAQVCVEPQEVQLGGEFVGGGSDGGRPQQQLFLLSS